MFMNENKENWTDLIQDVESLVNLWHEYGRRKKNKE